MDWDGRDDTIRLRVNYRDCARLGVDDVNLVANRIRNHVRRISADLQCPVLSEVDEVQNGHGVGTAVADVGVLPVSARDIGEAVPATARNPEEDRADNCSYGACEGVSEGRGHCSESIDVACRRQGKGTAAENLRIPAKLFGGFVCLCDRCEIDDLRIYRVICNLFSDNEAACFCGFVDFFNDACLLYEARPRQSKRHSCLER